MVPFQPARGRGAPVLTSAVAADWLHSCFGRGFHILGNTAACAARSLSSIQSVTRSHLVVVHSLQQHMLKKVEEALSPLAPRLSVVVFKRVCDETAVRLNMTEQALRLLLGDTMADAAESLRQRGGNGRGPLYPCDVVQNIQQMAYLRWGPGRQEAFELILPAKI